MVTACHQDRACDVLYFFIVNNSHEKTKTSMSVALKFIYSY